jgi:hypothetical protein
MVSQFKRMEGDKYAKNPTSKTPANNTTRPARTSNDALRESGWLKVAPDRSLRAEVSASASHQKSS